MEMDELRAAYPDWEFTSDSSGQLIYISASRDMPMCDPKDRGTHASVTLNFQTYGDYEEDTGNTDDSYPVECVAATMRQYLEGA